MSRAVGIVLVLSVLLVPMFVTMQSAKARTRLWNVSTAEELKEAAMQLSLLGGNGTINLAPGTYHISDTLQFRKLNHVSIIGSGWNTIIQKVGDGDVIRFIDSAFSYVRDVLIVGDEKAKEGSGIVFVGQSSSNMVDYCRIVGFAMNGIRFEGDPKLPQSSNTVSNCHFISNREEQFFSFHNNDFYILNNQFGAHGGVTPQVGALLDHSSAGTYSGNYHWNNIVAFKMLASNFNRIENNRFEESEREGMILGSPLGGGWNALNIIIGNTIHTNSKGASGKYAAVVAYYTVQTTFTNNQIFSWNENQYLTKTCLEVGRESSEWIIKDNIMRSSKEKPALVYDENAAHIVKDNIIK